MTPLEAADSFFVPGSLHFQEISTIVLKFDQYALKVHVLFIRQTVALMKCQISILIIECILEININNYQFFPSNKLFHISNVLTILTVDKFKWSHRLTMTIHIVDGYIYSTRVVNTSIMLQVRGYCLKYSKLKIPH